MEQIENTLVIGGEKKFAEHFIESVNTALKEQSSSSVVFNLIQHKDWDDSGSNASRIKSEVSVVICLKDSISHQLRNWGKKMAKEMNIKFIETSHKVSIAIPDLLKFFSGTLTEEDNTTVVEEGESIYSKWDHCPPLRIFNIYDPQEMDTWEGMPLYSRMPYSKRGKKQMIARWDKIYLTQHNHIMKEYANPMGFQAMGKEDIKSTFYGENKGKSLYYKMIELFKSSAGKKGSKGYIEVSALASHWVASAYHLNNLKDFSSTKTLNYALNLIFGVNKNDLMEGAKEYIKEVFPPTKRKTKTPQKPIKIVEEPPVRMYDNPVLAEETPIIEDISLNYSTDSIIKEVKEYVYFDDLKVEPFDAICKINFIKAKTIKIVGDLEVSIGSIDTDGLHNVVISRKDK